MAEVKGGIREIKKAVVEMNGCVKTVEKEFFGKALKSLENKQTY